MGPKSATVFTCSYLIHVASRSLSLFFCAVNAEACFCPMSHEVFRKRDALCLEVQDQLCLCTIERLPLKGGKDWTDLFLAQSFFFSSGANGTQSNQSLYVDAVMCYRLLDCCLGVERHFPNATIIGALRRKNGNVTGWLVVLQTYYKKKNGRFI